MPSSPKSSSPKRGRGRPRKYFGPAKKASPCQGARVDRGECDPRYCYETSGKHKSKRHCRALPKRRGRKESGKGTPKYKKPKSACNAHTTKDTCPGSCSWVKTNVSWRKDHCRRKRSKQQSPSKTKSAKSPKSKKPKVAMPLTKKGLTKIPVYKYSPSKNGSGGKLVPVNQSIVVAPSQPIKKSKTDKKSKKGKKKTKSPFRKEGDNNLNAIFNSMVL